MNIKEKLDRFHDFPDRFEVAINAFYSDLLKSGDTAVDCGAHIGKHSLPMARLVGDTGLVLALEPSPEKFNILYERSQKFSSLVVLPIACGEGSSLSEFTYLPDDPGKSSLLLRPHLQNNEQIKKLILKVLCLPIDDMIPEASRRVRFIKIDVEGAELLALRSAKSILVRDKPALHFELGKPSVAAFGYEASEVRRFLHTLGYLIFDIFGQSIVTIDEFLIYFEGGLTYDYLAVHPDTNYAAALDAVCAVWERSLGC